MKLTDEQIAQISEILENAPLTIKQDEYREDHFVYSWHFGSAVNSTRIKAIDDAVKTIPWAAVIVHLETKDHCELLISVL